MWDRIAADGARLGNEALHADEMLLSSERPQQNECPSRTCFRIGPESGQRGVRAPVAPPIVLGYVGDPADPLMIDR